MSLWYVSKVVIHIHCDMELGEVYQIYFSKHGRYITCKSCPNSVIMFDEAPSVLHWWMLTGFDDIASSCFEKKLSPSRLSTSKKKVQAVPSPSIHQRKCPSNIRPIEKRVSTSRKMSKWYQACSKIQLETKESVKYV